MKKMAFSESLKTTFDGNFHLIFFWKGYGFSFAATITGFGGISAALFSCRFEGYTGISFMLQENLYNRFFFSLYKKIVKFQFYNFFEVFNFILNTVIYSNFELHNT